MREFLVAVLTQLCDPFHHLWWYVAVINGFLYCRADIRYTRLKTVVEDVLANK